MDGRGMLRAWSVKSKVKLHRCSFLTKSSCLSAGGTSRKLGSGSAYTAAAFSGVRTGRGGLSRLTTDWGRGGALPLAERAGSDADGTSGGTLLLFGGGGGGGSSPRAVRGGGGLVLLLPPPNLTCAARQRSAIRHMTNDSPTAHGAGHAECYALTCTLCERFRCARSIGAGGLAGRSGSASGRDR